MRAVFIRSYFIPVLSRDNLREESAQNVAIFYVIHDYIKHIIASTDFSWFLL